MSRLVFVLEQTLGHVAHSRNLERTLADAGEIDATVIHLDYRPASGVRRLLPGVRTWTFDSSLRARAALRRRMRQGPVDAAFIHTQVAALFAGSVMRSIPTVISLDATPVNFDQEGPAYDHHRNLGLIEAAKRSLTRDALNKAAALVTWCRWAALSLVDDYGIDESRIHVIPPGVDMDMFRPGPPTPGTEMIRLLFVGGHFERKGGPDLLEAIQRLGSKVELDVVTSRRSVEVPPGVTCRVHNGMRPQSPELVNLYRRADVFVLPSRGDCLPQAVAEALASGLPVVATRVGAMSEMVNDGVNGYLVEPRDPRALGAALEQLVSRPDRRAALGRWSRILAEQHHDARTNNRAILDLMGRLASAKQPLLADA